MAQLTDTLAKMFPEITGEMWNLWGRWYAPIMCRLFPDEWDDKILVILDPDGEVHLRKWYYDIPSYYFADNLGEGQYVFAVRAISGNVDPIYKQRVYNWIYQMFTGPLYRPPSAPVMKITKDAFVITLRKHCATMSWKDLGKLYKLGLLFEHGVVRGRIFESMSEIVLGKGTGILVDSLIELRESSDAQRGS